MINPDVAGIAGLAMDERAASLVDYPDCRLYWFCSTCHAVMLSQVKVIIREDPW